MISRLSEVRWGEAQPSLWNLVRRLQLGIAQMSSSVSTLDLTRFKPKFPSLALLRIPNTCTHPSISSTACVSFSVWYISSSPLFSLLLMIVTFLGLLDVCFFGSGQFNYYFVNKKLYRWIDICHLVFLVVIILHMILYKLIFWLNFFFSLLSFVG